jgi:hypothetical protein
VHAQTTKVLKYLKEQSKLKAAKEIVENGILANCSPGYHVSFNSLE